MSSNMTNEHVKYLINISTLIVTTSDAKDKSFIIYLILFNRIIIKEATDILNLDFCKKFKAYN